MSIGRHLFLFLYARTRHRAVIDTGYNGFLTLPPDLSVLLGLPSS